MEQFRKFALGESYVWCQSRCEFMAFFFSWNLKAWMELVKRFSNLPNGVPFWKFKVKAWLIRNWWCHKKEKHSMGRCYSKQLNPSPLPSCAQAPQPTPLLLSHAQASSMLFQTWSNSATGIHSYGPDFEPALCVTWTGIRSISRETRAGLAAPC